jgi:hypothetical protein
MTLHLKARAVDPEATSIARQWLEVIFSMQSIPMLCNEDQQDQDSQEFVN